MGLNKTVILDVPRQADLHIFFPKSSNISAAADFGHKACKARKCWQLVGWLCQLTNSIFFGDSFIANLVYRMNWNTRPGPNISPS
jgi:hypothetical protein